mgnify:FL=1
MKYKNKTKKSIKKGGSLNVSPAHFDSTLSSHSVSQKLLNEDSTNLRDTKTKWALNNDFCKTLNRYINIKYSDKSEKEKRDIFEYLKKNEQTQKNYQTSVIANNTVNPRLFYSSYNSDFDKLYKGFGGKVLKKQNKTRKYKKGGGLTVSKMVNDFLNDYYPPNPVTPNHSIEDFDSIPIYRMNSINKASETPPRIKRTPPRRNLRRLQSPSPVPHFKFPNINYSNLNDKDVSLSELWDKELLNKIKHKDWNEYQINHALKQNPFRYNPDKTMKQMSIENMNEWYNPRQPEFGGK